VYSSGTSEQLFNFIPLAIIMYVDENHMSKSVVNRWNKQPQNWSRAHSFVHFYDRPDLPTVQRIKFCLLAAVSQYIYW